MAFQDSLRQSSEFQQLSGAQTTGSGQTGTAPDEGPIEANVPGQVAPIVSLEKGDLELWLRVATVILLYLIWRELQRQGGG